MTLLRPAALFVALCVGCASPQPPAVEPPAAPERPAASPELSSPTADDLRCLRISDAVEVYEALPQRFAAHARPVDAETLRAQMDAMRDGRTPILPPGTDADALAASVREALRTPFLFDDLESRLLDVTPVESERTEWGWRERVVLRDPILGCFPALILRLDGDGPFPALQAQHGHGDDPDSYAKKYWGAEHVQAGRLVLLPGTRAFNSSEYEDRAARAMLANGWTMMGVRVAEHLVAFEYLRSRPDVDPDRIALIGQSGGSVAGNLTVRLEERYRGYVSDLRGTYYNEGKGFVLDETAPSLYPLQHRINDFSTSRVPVLATPYAYTDGPEPIFAFLDRVVAPR